MTPTAPMAAEAAAPDAVIVTSLATDIALSPAVSFVHDDAGTMTFDEVRRMNSSRWLHAETPNPAFGAVRGAIWVKVRVINPAAEPVSRLLVMDQIFYRSLQFFVIGPDGAFQQRNLEMGDHKRDVDRDWQTPIFALTLAPGTTEIFVRYQHHVVNAGLHLRTIDAQASYEGKLFAIYSSVAISLIVVLLAITAYMLTANDFGQWRFAFFVFAALYSNFFGLGFSRFVLGDAVGSYGWYLSPLEISGIAMMVLTQHFLDLKARAPKVNLGINIYNVCLVLNWAISLIDPALNNKIGAYFLVPNLILVSLAIQARGWRTRESIIYVIAILPFYFAGVNAVLVNGGYWPLDVAAQFRGLAPQPVSIIIFAYGIGNQIGRQMLRAQARLKASEAELIAANERLEQTVESRTKHLREAQAQLVQAEKLASLGGMVAGVAHEINTPLGVGLTGATHALHRADELGQAISSGSIKRSDLAQAITEIIDGCKIVVRNLNRADELVQSFKRVAADQTSEVAQTIDLADYVQDVLRSLEPTLKQARVAIICSIDPGLVLATQPGAIAQVVTNLIQNAVTHAFEGIDGPVIQIAAKAAPHNKIQMTITDNGRGMESEVRAKAFDPFFTTRRGRGGTGLGLHIVFNLVTGALGGSLDLATEPGKGCVFTLILPRDAPAAA